MTIAALFLAATIVWAVASVWLDLRRQARHRETIRALADALDAERRDRHVRARLTSRDVASMIRDIEHTEAGR